MVSPGETLDPAKANSAAAYIQKFARSRHSVLTDVWKETRPNGGYGQYEGADIVRDAGSFLHSMADEKLLNTSIPDDYASPESLKEMLLEFRDSLLVNQDRIDCVVSSHADDEGGAPYNAVVLSQYNTEYRRALDHALSMMAADNGHDTLTQSSPRPSPPNWANMTSALVALIALVFGIGAWATTLELRVRALETKPPVEQIPSREDKLAIAKAQTCEKLALKQVELSSDNYTTAAKETDDLMLRMQCVTSGRK